MSPSSLLTFLFQRPIGVLMSFLAVAVLSWIGFSKLPVSLLPPIDVPQLLVQVEYRGHSPAEIEQNVLRPLRESLLTVKGLSDLKSEALSESGQLRLFFAFGTDMTLAYIEANEKLDRLLNYLPKEVSRPHIIKINTNDIPLARLQIVPKEKGNLLETSELVEKVLKKRLEGIAGVSLVDANGLKRKQISVRLHQAELAALQVSENQLVEAITQANQPLSSVSVKDGQYRYFLKSVNLLADADALRRLPIRLAKGRVVRLETLATITLEEEMPQGFHLFADSLSEKKAQMNLKEGFVLTLHKQPDAQMQALMEEIEKAVADFRQKYPTLDFSLTQNQSQFLDLAIANLRNTLLLGALGAFIVLFFFLGNWRMPLMIGVSLPLSLLLGFGLFYVMGLTINIISLSGLALGLGMLIDNSIIVLDNIERFLKEGKSKLVACVLGVQDVVAPLLSSMLTTLSVFLPLIFMNGISGALFYDQALSITLVLTSSLAVAFLFLPHLFLLSHKKKANSFAPTLDFSTETRFFQKLLQGYEFIFWQVMRHQKIGLLFFIGLIAAPFFISKNLKVERLPTLSKPDFVLKLDWNLPLSSEQNLEKTLFFLHQFEGVFSQIEIDLGKRQYLLEGEGSTQSQVFFYFALSNFKDKKEAQKRLQLWLENHAPQALFQFEAAPDAFSQLFASPNPNYELRFRNPFESSPLSVEKVSSLYETMPYQAEVGSGMRTENSVILQVEAEKAAIYGFSQRQILEKIKQSVGHYFITDIKSFGEVLPIRLAQNQANIAEILQNTYLEVADNTQHQKIPLHLLVRIERENDYRNLTADALGIYQSFVWQDLEKRQQIEIDSLFKMKKEAKNLQTTWAGNFIENEENLQQLFFILLISVVLLYFILVAQFESFLQPLIVVLTLPLGISGAFLVLYWGNASLNLMSAIGLVVMLGIMVNDAILKIDTINKLKKQLPTTDTREILHLAGVLRLKPILMTTLTTILAVLPTLFSAGLGAELQTPLVLAVIGGLGMGTATALFFIPLLYLFFDFKK
ncbi:efflux RND transporter permease subunit [Hugenholtzia roseola]|uniref:efflux RND transporter permease subunit n=1 Tax=Hugenholtzia roseola TaxID=1002 RepID=UPI0003FFF4F2|nr:efflux RND transporter permease subunit [Hugenholtzia roseola]